MDRLDKLMRLLGPSESFIHPQEGDHQGDHQTARRVEIFGMHLLYLKMIFFL